jgi:hypothetical protein
MFKLCIQFVLATSLLYGQTEIKEGVEYKGLSILTVSSLGLTLTIPENWTAVFPQGASALIIGSHDQQSTLIVTAESMDALSVQELMQQTSDLGNGIILIPKSSVSNRGNHFECEYSVNGSAQELNAFAEVLVGDFEIGVLGVVLSTPSSFESGKSGLQSLIQSVKFNKPKPTFSETTVGVPWADYLRGKTLKYYYTTSGFSSQDYIYLCADGSFYRKSRDSSVSNLGTGSMRGSNQGRWAANGQGNSGTLQLVNSDGSSVNFQIHYGEGNKGTGLYLNGSRYYIDTNDQCQ